MTIFSLRYKTTRTSYINSDLRFNTKYVYKVSSYAYSNGESHNSKYTVVTAKTILVKPVVKASRTYTSYVKLTWNKVPGAQKYYIYRCNSSGNSCKYIKYTTLNTYKDRLGKKGVKYIYKVIGVRNGFKGYTSVGVIGLRK